MRAGGKPGRVGVDFRGFLEALPAAACTCDADGRITYFNQRALELWGRAPALDSAADRYCGALHLFAPDGTPIPHEQSWMALALRTGQEYRSCEILVERPDGSRVAVLANANPLRDDAGQLIGAVNILIDITDRRLMEEALRASRGERDRQLADLTRLHEMSARMSATLELQPILQAVLQAACAIDRTDLGLIALGESDLGPLQTQASIGFDAATLRRIETAPASAGPCARAFAERRRVVFEDVSTAACSEDYREVARAAGFLAVHSTPLITRAGRNIGVLSTHSRQRRAPSPWQAHLLDLCARQAADIIENAQLYAQINEQQRRKDEFLAVLAHELRNPLAPIGNAVQVLQAPHVQEQHRDWAARVIDRQVRHLARLVDDLLDLQRITNGKLDLRRTRIDVSAVVEAALEASRPLIASRGHQLVLELSAEPIHVDGDLTRLAQVVADLLDNAAKFTVHGGTIVVRTERCGTDAVIRVGDNGIGIPPEQLSRIFQMFEQSRPPLDPGQGGLGVGLTLAKRLVELHDGAITAHSEGINRGSEFVVRLPAREPERPVQMGDSATATAPSGLRILIVDDNRDSAASLALLLRLMGNDVRTGHDGREAVTQAEEFHPDAILLDIGLPVLSGFEAARQIRAGSCGGDCVLVAITGWGQDSDRTRSREAGFDHHLVKPVDVARLLEILHGVRARAHEGGRKRRRRVHAAGPGARTESYRGLSRPKRPATDELS